MVEQYGDAAAAARALWSGGDYASVGEKWAGVGQALVAEAGVAGLDVLDIATGTGAVAIAAARDGGQVTAVDVSPELLATAATRAATAGVAVDWREADMTDLPAEDASFDRVLSSLGAMFAPEPEAMAAELVRVCRPGGAVASTAWTPDSPYGRLQRLMARFRPDPPAAARPPSDWGDPDTVAKFFDGLPVTLTTAVHTVTARWDSVEAAVAMMEQQTPPVVAARAAIEPTGRWPEARQEITALLAEANTACDGSLTLPVSYLTVFAHV